MPGYDIAKAVAYHEKRSIVADGDELAALVAAFQHARGLEVDGKFGPGTRAALLADIELAREPAEPHRGTIIVRTQWEPFDGPIHGNRPNTVAELNGVYGDPTGGDAGAVEENSAWRRANLISRGPSNPLPGVFTTGPGRWVTVHRLVEAYLEEALRRAQLACPGYIVRLGGFNFRRMRHDNLAKAKARGFKPPLFPLSRHSWGCAVDANSNQNLAIDFGKLGRRAPEPWSDEWIDCWPEGLPQPWVEAWESVGWRWGGRWRDYCDPMHFELAGGPDGVQL